MLDSLKNHRSGFFVTLSSSWRNGCSIYSGKRRGDFIIAGMPYGKPSRKIGRFPVFFLVFFSESVKVLPVTPLVSGVFVHRAFCAYFLRIERVVELRRFLWWTQ